MHKKPAQPPQEYSTVNPLTGETHQANQDPNATTQSPLLIPKKQEESSTYWGLVQQKLKALPQKLASLNKTALVLALPVASAYVLMNTAGTVSMNSTGFRDSTASESSLVNFGLYYIVFSNYLLEDPTGEKFNTFQKFRNLFSPSRSGFTMPACAAFIFLSDIIAALPMLETSVQGADQLGLPVWFGMSNGWYMTLARSAALFQGFVGLPATWDFLKNSYLYTDRNDPAQGDNGWKTRLTIAILGAISVLGSAYYVFNMRTSACSALGNVDAMTETAACAFQAADNAWHLATQIYSMIINYPFYLLYIPRGLIIALEPFWNEKARAFSTPQEKILVTLRLLAVALIALTFFPAIAPLFVDLKGSVAPVFEGLCQITGQWVAKNTEFAWELTNKLPASITTGAFALFMNYFSVGVNIGAWEMFTKKVAAPDENHGARAPRAPGSVGSSFTTRSEADQANQRNPVTRVQLKPTRKNDQSATPVARQHLKSQDNFGLPYDFNDSGSDSDSGKLTP